jgi:sugar/nucleoside kinase (ribokinase family)
MGNVLVIGAVLLDITATYKPESEGEAKPIGVLWYSVGGNAFNAAANLAMRDFPTAFMTCLKPHSLGTKTIRLVLENSRIDDRYVFESDVMVEPVYIAHYCGHELKTGITSCEIDKVGLNGEILEEAVKKADLVAVDTNMSTDQIRQICRVCSKHKKPIFVSIVSDSKAGRVYRKSFDHMFEVLCLNSEEAGFLGVSVDVNSPKEEITRVCRDFNSERVFITCGPQGYFSLRENGDLKFTRASEAAEVINVSGAGDAFFAALCAGRFRKEPLDGDVVRIRITEWVTAVLAREGSNLGPRDFSLVEAKPKYDRSAILTAVFCAIAIISMTIGTFAQGITPIIFGACLFCCSVTSGAAGSLIRDLRSAKEPDYTGSRRMGTSVALGMVAGLCSALLFIVPHLSIGNTASKLRSTVDDFNLLVLLAFIVSLVAGIGVESFFSGLEKGRPMVLDPLSKRTREGRSL